MIGLKVDEIAQHPQHGLQICLGKAALVKGLRIARAERAENGLFPLIQEPSAPAGRTDDASALREPGTPGCAAAALLAERGIHPVACQSQGSVQIGDQYAEILSRTIAERL